MPPNFYITSVGVFPFESFEHIQQMRPTHGINLTLSLFYRGFALLAAAGLVIASFPVEHTHETSGENAHGLHVHAHEGHVHHSNHHHRHDHRHDVPGTPAHDACEHGSGESNDEVPHIHMLVLDLDLPAEVVFDPPRPVETCVETILLSIIPADTNDGLRIPGARGPPLG